MLSSLSLFFLFPFLLLTIPVLVLTSLPPYLVLFCLPFPSHVYFTTYSPLRPPFIPILLSFYFHYNFFLLISRFIHIFLLFL